MFLVLRLTLNLLLALLVCLAGSYIVLASHRRPNTWLWGVIFGVAVALTITKAVPMQPGWLIDFRAVVMALGGFVGGWSTYLVAMIVASAYRYVLGGDGTTAGIAVIVSSGLVGVWLAKRWPRRFILTYPSLASLGMALALITIFFLTLGSYLTPGAQVISMGLVMSFVTLTPLGTVVAFKLFALICDRLTEQAVIEAAVTSLPTALAALDRGGHILFTNYQITRHDISSLPIDSTGDPITLWGRKFLVDRKIVPMRNQRPGQLVALDDVTDWYEAFAQLQNFFDVALDLLVILGPDQAIEQANAVAEQYGLRAELPFMPIVGTQQRVWIDELFVQARLQPSKPFAFEHEFTRNDGSLGWMSWSMVAEDGGRRIFAVGRDITDDKLHFDALRQQTELSQQQNLFLELAADAVVALGLSGEVLFWNNGAVRTYGFLPSEALGKNFCDMVRDQRAHTPTDWQGITTRHHRDGRALLVECRQSFQRDQDGRPLKMLDVSRDITAREKSRQTTAHLAAIVEQSGDAILSLDHSGRIVTANTAAGILLGCPGPALVGDAIWRFVATADRSRVRREFDGVRSQGASRHVAAQLISEAGQEVPVSIALSSLPDQRGQARGISMIIHDLAPQQALDSEMRRLDRLSVASQLAKGIGHEIRNPLTTVRGFLQLFGMREELSSYRYQFELLIQAIDRMDATLREFLMLAQNQALEMSPTDINQVILSILPLLEADASPFGCAIKCELTELPPINANAGAIRQVIVNLVRNAQEVSPAGSAITIRTELAPGRVVLTVCDSGPGIPPELQPQIGTPFFTTKPDGTGLGLTVCHTIATQHRATLRFDSSSDGTCFQLVFPGPDEPQSP